MTTENTLLQSNDIVLVVDMLHDFVDPEGALYVPGAEALIPRVDKLVEHAYDVGADVLYVCDSHTQDDPEFKRWPRHAVEGTLGAEIVKALPVKSTDQVYLKSTISALTNPRLVEHLEHWFEENRGEGCVYLAGVATDHCIQAAAKGLNDLLISVGVVVDCIAGVNPVTSARALMDMGTFAFPVTVDDLLSPVETAKE